MFRMRHLQNGRAMVIATECRRHCGRRHRISASDWTIVARCTSGSTGGTSADASSCSRTSARWRISTIATCTSSARSSRRPAVQARMPSVLIDGQQLTTSVLRRGPAPHRPVVELPRSRDQLQRVLVHLYDATRTKLPACAWASVFERVVLDLPLPPDEPRDSPVRRQLRLLPESDQPRRGAPYLGRGLQEFEHVAITLGAGANAQQDLREPELRRASRCAITS